MSYIRTKDGIYKLIKIRKNEYRMLNADGTVHLAHYESEDYKIADTIEELCTGYALLEQNGKLYNIFLKCNDWTSEEVSQIADIKNLILVGFVEIENGIKYVAKMNSEGELKLI